MKAQRPGRRRRWLAVIVVALLLIPSGGYAFLRLELEGPELGERVAKAMNQRMRGRISIGSIEWSSDSLAEVVTGGWIPVTVRDVKVWDDCVVDSGEGEPDELRANDPLEECTLDERPEPGSSRKPRKLLLDAPLITGEVDAHALMFGNHDFVFRHLWVHGGRVLLEETREPYPLHAYDRKIVTLLTAFYPRLPRGFHVGIYNDQPPPVFDLRDIHVRDVELAVHMNPYKQADGTVAHATVARIERVEVENSSYLYMNANDPLVPRFYVRLEAKAPRGSLAITAADRTVTLAITDVVLHRLAQLPTRWTRHDTVANTLEVDGEARVLPCGGDVLPVRLRVSGELFSYWDRPYDGRWNLVAEIGNLGPTLRTCLLPDAGGDHLDARITATGPFVAQPKLGVHVENVEYVVHPGTGGPLPLTLALADGAIDLVDGQGSIDRATVLVHTTQTPGEVTATATFGLVPPQGRAHVEVTKPIDLTRFLPPTARPAGHLLLGRLWASRDDDGHESTDIDPSLGRTFAERAVRVSGGKISADRKLRVFTLDRVNLAANRSHAQVDGTIDFGANQLDLTISAGAFPDLGDWLARFQLPGFAQSGGL